MMNKQQQIRAVNLLYLFTFFLMLSNLFLTWMPQYVRLVIVQILMVFLPAYIFLRLMQRRTGQSLAERVRWRWPGWKIGLLALLTGAGLYPFSAITAGILTQVLGYTEMAAPADAIPTTVLMGALAILSYVILAPLCEEYLFRGVIQPVYELRSARWGVLFVGLMFIAFHLSLLQGLSIILLSLALGYVNYRSRSLQASILTHFGANFLASLVITDQVFNTGAQTFLFTPPVIIGGFVMSAISLVLLTLLTRRMGEEVDPAVVDSEVEDVIPAAPRPRRSWLSVYWPLLVALLIYLPLISAEVIFARSPELVEQLTGVALPAEALVLNSAPWQEEQEWQYEIRNPADDVVGTGECALSAGTQTAEITCFSAVGAYEVQQGNSYFSSSGGERTDRLVWTLDEGRMLAGSSNLHLSSGDYLSQIEWSIAPDSIAILNELNGEPQDLSISLAETPLAQNPALLVTHNYTWPWQLAAIQLQAGQSGSVVAFQPCTWRSATNDQGPVTETRQVRVAGQEEVSTPAGVFTAWKITSGRDQTAWIDSDDGRTVVKFFNGVETWALK